MPTGYTAKLMERGQTFPEFVLTCARAFGACIDLRDEPHGAPIPEAFSPSDYYVKALADAQLLVSTLTAMGEIAQREFGKRQKQNAIEQSRNYVAEKKLENQRLEDMRVQVEEWAPPTQEHEGIKKFMLQQISISMNDTSYSEEILISNEEKEPIDFYYAALVSAKSSAEYHAKKSQQEAKRSDGNTEWVKQLRESL